MKRNLLSIVSVSSLVVAGALIAPQVFARGPTHLFDEFDANKDGKITRAEAQQKVLEHFKLVDKNQDKVVTKTEAQAHHEAKRKEHGNPEAFVEARFKAHDTNKNGKIERSESKLPTKIFDRIDANSDGSITKAEALEAHKKRMANASERHRHAHHDDRKGHKGYTKDHKSHGGSNESGRRARPEPFARIDTSGDGKISEAEAKGAADRVFSRIDRNNDNVITHAEVDQLKKHHHPRPRGKGPDKKQK